MEHTWFPRDGIIIDLANETIQSIIEKFDCHVIARNDGINSSSRFSVGLRENSIKIIHNQ